MCIICNCGDEGDEFLYAFELSRDAMGNAKEAMLKCTKTAKTQQDRARYDAVHKAMVRLTHAWNRLEERREH